MIYQNEYVFSSLLILVDHHYQDIYMYSTIQNAQCTPKIMLRFDLFI